MKADIHPAYHEITITQTDGSEFVTRSAMGKPGDKMRLDVDPLSHPAWQGGTQKVVEKQQLKKFESKYGSFLSGSAGREDAQAAAEMDKSQAAAKAKDAAKAPATAAKTDAPAKAKETGKAKK